MYAIRSYYAILGQIQQLVPGQRPVGARSKYLEQLELHGGDRYLPPVGVEQLAPLHIQRSDAERDPGCSSAYRSCVGRLLPGPVPIASQHVV